MLMRLVLSLATLCKHQGALFFANREKTANREKKKTSRKTKVCLCDTLGEAEKPTKCSCRSNALGWRAPKRICPIPAFGRFPQRSGTPALNNEHYSTASSNAAINSCKCIHIQIRVQLFQFMLIAVCGVRSAVCGVRCAVCGTFIHAVCAV